MPDAPRLLLLLLLLTLGLISGGCNAGAKPAGPITIAYTGDFFGFQRPCP